MPDRKPTPGFKNLSSIAKLRVLHITAGNIFGGIERTLETIVLHPEACPQAGHEIALCYWSRFASEIEAAGVPLHTLGEAHIRYPWTIVRGRMALKKIIRDRRIELLVTHASWGHAMFASVAKRLGVPVVFWIHDLFTNETWLEKWAARTVPDALIFNSRFTRDNSRFPREDIPTAVIYNPVRHQTVVGGREYADREATRLELGAKHNDCVISQIARIDRYKGHRLLLSALALLRTNDQWVCWVVGAATAPPNRRLLDELLEYGRTLGISERVHFLGERNDISHIMAASDIMVHPNLLPEPFGNVIIEALWHGLPVVAVNMAGPAEILAPNYGILVRPDDPGALAASIGQLIANPASAAELRARGPQRARELCDPVTQTGKLCSFLETVAKTGSRATPPTLGRA